MTDTPISLLRIIIAEVEPECTCTRRFGRGYQMAAAGQGEGTCLHCRIKAVLAEADEKAIAVQTSVTL